MSEQFDAAAYAAYTKEIEDLCFLAGRPNDARAFILARTPPDKVRSALLALQRSATLAASPARSPWDQFVIEHNARRSRFFS